MMWLGKVPVFAEGHRPSEMLRWYGLACTCGWTSKRYPWDGEPARQEWIAHSLEHMPAKPKKEKPVRERVRHARRP